MIFKSTEGSNAVSRFFLKNFGAAYYLMNKKRSERKAEIFFSNPETKNAVEVWDMMDKGIVK